MKRAPLLAWVLLFLYGVWALALQGLLAAPRLLGACAPDLGLVLLLALGARLVPARARVAAVLIALARAGFSADPPAAELAGYLGAVGLSAALRAGLEIDRPLARALLAGLLSLLLTAFWLAVRMVALAAEPGGRGLGEALLWPGALATAAAALFLAPALRRLPGLADLWRGRA